MMKKDFNKLFRNFIFGVEDSLVSSVGLLSGIAAAGATKSTIVLTGIVLIFVEAFSMSVGSILSDHSERELEKHEDIPIKGSIAGGVVMLFSYFIAGFIPLSPYMIFARDTAFWLSIVATLIGLYILGYVSGKITKTHPTKEAIEMFLLGGAAVGVGVIVGLLLKVS